MKIIYTGGNKSKYEVDEKEYLISYAYNNEAAETSEDYFILGNMFTVVENIPEGEYKVVLNLYSDISTSMKLNSKRKTKSQYEGEIDGASYVASDEVTFIVTK